VLAVQNDIDLLDRMMIDYDHQVGIHRAGPFWKSLCDQSVLDIHRVGISDFRGSSSAIGWGFTDNTFHETKPLDQRHRSILSDPRTTRLLERYKVPETLIGGALNVVEIDNRKLSAHYLGLLAQHDQIAHSANYQVAKNLFEIGGGFGVNVHLVLDNYPNIRKVLYLDVPPNLYIGTQYLKAFYGERVRDYRATRSLSTIQFSNDGEIEIIAIAPWQLSQVSAQFEIFHNAHSFVEMPQETVRFYAEQAMRLLAKGGTVTLLSYDCFDLNTTFHPDLLPSFFPDMIFEKVLSPVLDGRYGIISYCGHRRPRVPALRRLVRAVLRS
jgi:putative sugar O-methyltransferase